MEGKYGRRDTSSQEVCTYTTSWCCNTNVRRYPEASRKRRLGFFVTSFSAESRRKPEIPGDTGRTVEE